MTHHARNIAFLPNIAEACDRIATRAKAKNKDDELLAAAVSVLHDWRDYPAAVVRGAIVTAEKSDDGYAIQMARQVKGQINDAERIARNRAAALPVDETPLRIAMRHGARWPDIIAGAVAFVAYVWVLFTLGAMIVEAL
jgi:hypothetical protein